MFTSSSISYSPIPSLITSSSSDSPLCTSITPSLFHSVKLLRVTLKVEIRHTGHSHIIGKVGSNIKNVMRATGCHIHKSTNFTNPIPRSFTSSSRTASTDFCLDRFFWATRFLILFFHIFVVSGPCARLSWSSCQLLSARQSSVSYRIVSRIWTMHSKTRAIWNQCRIGRNKSWLRR